MSHRVGNIAVIVRTPPAKCELCGKVDELRPYGPKGENICFDCKQKNPKSAKRQMRRVLFGEEIQ